MCFGSCLVVMHGRWVVHTLEVLKRAHVYGTLSLPGSWIGKTAVFAIGSYGLSITA
jgi:hypothetical protein